MPRPIRVLMVSYEFPPLGGGTGNAVFHVLREMTRFPEIRVDLLTSGVSGAGEPDETAAVLPSITVHRVPIGKAQRHYWTAQEIAFWTMRVLPLARRLVSAGGYDLCHCWSGWPSGIVGYSSRSRIPYLVALRGSDVPGYNPRLRLLDPIVFRRLARLLWRNAIARTCVSKSLASLASKTDPALAVEIIGNGVDADRFRPGTRAPGFLALFVGRLVERKDVSLLLEAFARLPCEREDLRLGIVGDGPEKADLVRLAGRLGIGERVDFRGALDGVPLTRAYQEASVFVLAARNEAMSNAALEAMASGLPVITTRTGVAELVDGNGIVIEKRDRESIAGAIRTYVEDEDLRRRHGERSRAIAMSLTWGKAARAYLDLYDRVLGGGTDDGV